MEDNRQYANVGASHAPPPHPVGEHHEPKPEKPRRHWNRIGLFLIILGAIMLGIGWIAGARGGSLVWENGRMRVLSVASRTSTDYTIPNSNTIREITIESSSARVTVEPTNSSNDPITVSIVNMENYNIQHTATSLTVNTRFHQGVTNFQFIGVGFYQPRQEIIVRIPANQADSITITASSGGVRAESVNATQWMVNSSSGGVRVANIQAESFSAQASSGGVQLSNIQAETFSARTTSGGVRLDNIQAETFSANSTSGSVQMNNVQVESLNAGSTSGGIRGANVHFTVGNIGNTSGGVNLSNVSWVNLNARTVSGSLRVTNAYIHSGHIVNAQTNLSATSGGVRLELRNSSNHFNYSLTSTSGSRRVDGNRFGGRGTNSGGSGNHPITLQSISGGVRLNFNS